MRFYLQMLAGGQALDKQHRSNGVVARWGVLGRASEDAQVGLPGSTSSSGGAVP